MIKAFIFDVGGTLVKTDEAIFHAIGLALKENGVVLKDRKKVIHALGKNTYIIVKTAVEISYSGKDVKEKGNICFESFKKIFPKHVITHFKLFPHVKETLELFKKRGIKLAVFTGFDRTEAKFLLEKMHLSKYFDFVVTVEDVEEPRPHPDALILAAKRLEIKVGECIYVGDTVVDIQMAKNAKMKVVCVKTGIQDNKILEKEKPDYFVKDFSEMMEQISSQLPN